MTAGSIVVASVGTPDCSLKCTKVVALGEGMTPESDCTPGPQHGCHSAADLCFCPWQGCKTLTAYPL